MSNPTTRRRPAVVGFVAVAALACLILGWWQWSRFESGSGSFQNLGYAMQWPLFAVFVVYAYRRFVRLEDQEVETDQPAGSGSAAPPPTELPAGVLPPRRPMPAPHDEEDDPTLRDYNAYLAELDERDAGGARAGKASS